MGLAARGARRASASLPHVVALMASEQLLHACQLSQQIGRYCTPTSLHKMHAKVAPRRYI